MLVPPTAAWKLVLAILLAGAIVLSVCLRAPRRAVPRGDLGRLVLSALALYGVGGAASLTHHVALAMILYATGILVCAFASWLSRGTDSGEPPGGSDPVDEPPPPEPDGAPEFDWARFEKAYRAYAERQGDPTTAR